MTIHLGLVDYVADSVIEGYYRLVWRYHRSNSKPVVLPLLGF